MCIDEGRCDEGSLKVHDGIHVGGVDVGATFVTDPRDFEKPLIPSSSFSPSFVFQFKQALWHSGILSSQIHKTAGKGADVYEHQHDYWKLENHFSQSV